MKFHLVSLGCSKNTADSEWLIHELRGQGGSWVDRPEDADLLLLNTCGFIRDAKEESLRMIMDLIGLRQANPGLHLVVFGCLVKRYREELQRDIPEVDRFLEFIVPGDVETLLQRVQTPWASQPLTTDHGGPRLSPPHIGILKIAEGCSNRCSYCAIPDIRGDFRSRPPDEIRKDLNRLIQNGAREISIVAQDTTRYGEDLGQTCLLPALCAEIGARPEVVWIRLHYLHPARLTPQLLESMFSLPKVVPYFDIPFQHVSDPILKRMGRQVTRRDLIRLLGFIRRRWRRAVIRSTFIVGFPGESEDDFECLTDFLESHPIDRVGAFAYSAEEGTPARNYRGRVTKQAAARRLDELMTLQQVLAGPRNEKRWVGRSLPILIDRLEGNEAIGRTFGDAWQVDNLTHIRYDGSFQVGDVVIAHITGADAYDFHAERIR